MTYQQSFNKIAKLMLGNSIIESIIAEDGKVTLKKYFKARSRVKKLNREFRESKIHLENL